MAKKQDQKIERITPREAAIAASTYYAQLTGVEKQVSIEEIELSQDGDRWLVTLGFSESPIAFGGPRTYKMFEVNAHTGEVLSMKIRKA